MERSRAQVNPMAALIFSGAPAAESVPLAWPLVCGNSVAQRTCAREFEKGELVVEVPDKSWRQELAGYMPHYLHQLKCATGISVERIRFVVAPHSGSSR
ncbi:MAG: DciA family protein [Acidobacteriaceae bacterium]